jgi:NAD-dependent SIR2 family protein deacetylase
MTNQETIDKAAKCISQSKRVVALTGAGISAESGYYPKCR